MKAISRRMIGRLAPPVFLLACLLSFSGCGRPMEERLLSPDTKTRSLALTELREMPYPEKEEMAVSLIRLLPDANNNLIERANQAFLVIGAPALPVLIGAVDNQDALVRLSAISALKAMRIQDPSVVSAFLKAMNDSHPMVRAEAADGLGNLGVQEPAVLSALLKARSDKNNDVRDAAQTALNNLASIPPPKS